MLLCVPYEIADDAGDEKHDNDKNCRLTGESCDLITRCR